MQSLHVPAATMQRIMRVAAWLAPSSATIMAAVLFTYRWFGSRASLEDVGQTIAMVSLDTKAAQKDAHHAASLADDHSTELRSMWWHVIAMRAELRVLREYGKQDAPTRSKYIEQAQGFYSLQFEEKLKTHANDPAEAARLALMETWRPDR